MYYDKKKEYYKNFINCYIDVKADLNDILTRHPYIQKKIFNKRL